MPSLTPDIGVGSGAQSFCDVAADLQRRAHARTVQRLRVGIRTNEINTLDTCIDHMSDGVTAAAADTNHFYHCALAVRIHQFKHFISLR